jgi:hypothetical protein
MSSHRFHKILVTMLTILALTGSAMADTGYMQDYDYPNQGDDWYGGMNAPDSRRDFPPLDMDQVYNGNDFGVGYERQFDPLGHGPGLELFQGRYTEYQFRFGNQAFYGYDCWSDGDCGTGTWCVSQPTCQFVFCYPGTYRDCSDGNPCTDDTCNSSLQECLHDWVQPPGDVTGLMLSRESGSTVATLSWDDRYDEEWYNVYRGEAPSLNDLACYLPGIVGTSADDDGSIPVSGLYIHLVTADHTCGEGRLGIDSDYNLRFNYNPCP